MTAARHALRSALRGGLALGLVVVGLILPFDFFEKVTSLTMTLGPWGIIRSYAAAWVAYFVVATVLGILLSGALTGVMLLLRYNASPALAANLLVAATLSRLAALYALTLAYSPGARPLAVVIAYRVTTVGIFLWLIWRQQAILNRIRGFLNAVAVVGCVAVALALIADPISRSGAAHAQSPGATPDPKGTRPPIILLTVDTLSANRMSLYGYSRQTTPSLDKFAEEFQVFEQHYSNSNFTTPSVASFLTGTRPWTHRAFHLFGRPLESVAREGLVPTLQRIGYRTISVATNPWASAWLQGIEPWFSERRLGHVGIVHMSLVNLFPQLGPVINLRAADHVLPLLQLGLTHDSGNRHYDPETAFAAARDALSSQQDGSSTFLWVHLLGPHAPYSTPPPFLKSFDPTDKALTARDSSPVERFRMPGDPNFPGVFSGRYDEAVRYNDHYIGLFLDWLKSNAWFDDALIIITSDHGESFTHSYARHSGPLLHDDLVRIPLLIKPPRQRSPRRIHDFPTEHADLFPTVLDYVGLPVPGHVEGRSLRRLIERGGLQPGRVFTMNFERNSVFGPIRRGTVAVVEGSYKYVTYIGPTNDYTTWAHFEDSLFDLRADPGENANLVSTRPDHAARLRAEIEAQVAAHSLPKEIK